MFSKFLLSLTFLACFWAPHRALAHPVAYAGSYSIMTWNSKDMTDWMFTHTFTPQYSLSAHYLRLNTIEGKREYYIPAVNFLARRWNELDSQANVYLTVGHGGEKVKSSMKDTSLLALEADWESRKYYVSFREEAILSYKKNGIKERRDIFMTKVRAGFAPYLAEFNELNAWFILEAEKINRSENNFELTPFVRLFYRNVLTEMGVNQKGEAKFNFMIHY